MIFRADKQNQRLKWAFESCKNGTWGDEPDGENNVHCIRAADFDGQLGRLVEAERTVRAVDKVTFEKTKLSKGDLILEKSGGGEKQLVGRAVLYNDKDKAVCSNFLARCKPAPSVHSVFLNYLMLAIYVARGTYPHIKQSTGIQNLDLSSFLDIKVDIPPIKTQHRIAQFLDQKTAQIDGLIEKKRALLDRLAEKRQALITRAVTKGLNPDVPMKPSGIDWLGDIPKHWEQCGIGQKIKLQRGVDITKSARVDGPIPVVSSGGIEYFHDVALCDGPGVLIGRKGSAGKLHFVSTPYWPHDTTLYVREFRGNHARFVWYVLHILDLASFDSGSSNPTVNRNNVHPARTVWPPLNEQISICEFLDQEMSRFDLQKDLVESSVDRLNEYRAALITAAVTGQLEVA